MRIRLGFCKKQDLRVDFQKIIETTITEKDFRTKRDSDGVFKSGYVLAQVDIT